MRIVSSLFLPLVLVSLLIGCKDALLEPDVSGRIRGSVLDFGTAKPLSGASITTSPPTSAIVADASGAFTIEDVPEGNYTITANRTGYLPSTVTVAVRGDRETQAVISLKRDTLATNKTPAITAEVTGFVNQGSVDSSFVQVEYRVRNPTAVTVAAYEAYFRIATTTQTFYQEIKGADLGIGQSDIGSFRKYIGRSRATNVTVDGTWTGDAPKP